MLQLMLNKDIITQEIQDNFPGHVPFDVRNFGGILSFFPELGHIISLLDQLVINYIQ